MSDMPQLLHVNKPFLLSNYHLHEELHVLMKVTGSKQTFQAIGRR